MVIDYHAGHDKERDQWRTGDHCRRYRPAARIPQTIDSATSHIGFRCVIRDSSTV
jgi:formylglycine-generating enzyme required for sulfatase activity